MSVDRLAFGMATAMREPSTAARQELLDVAYELGIRRFDVAPIYGFGKAEAELGRLVRRGADQARVTTKYGRRLSATGRMIGAVQAPARRLARAVPRARAAFHRSAGGVDQVPAPTFAEFAAAADRSRETLGVDRLAAFLAHEVAWSEGWTALFAEADGAALPADRLGVSGPPDLLAGCPPLALAGAVQVGFAPGGPTTPATSVYGVLSDMLPRLHAIGPDPLEALLGGVELVESDLAAIAVAYALDRYPDAAAVVGTSDPAHLRILVAGLPRWQDTDRARWDALAAALATA